MEFPFPMFITTWHMLFATVLTQVLSRTTDMLPGVKEVWPPQVNVAAFFSELVHHLLLINAAKGQFHGSAEPDLAGIRLLRLQPRAEQQSLHIFIGVVHPGNSLH
jgi:hypothetical protein